MRSCRLHLKRYRNGFTLPECILSLMVVGIILAAAATLAFAMNSAEKVTDKMGESQTYVRYATMRVSELIRNCNMVFATSYFRNGIVVWTDDDGDGQIDPLELVYVEYDSINAELDMVSYSNLAVGAVDRFAVNEVKSGSARITLEAIGTGRYTNIVFGCTAALFSVADPVGDLVNISFIVKEDDISKLYQITSRRMVSMDYLLDGSGNLLSGDDDL